MSFQNNLGTLFDVLAKNPDDVSDIINRFGGLTNLIKAGPAIYRIMQTVATRMKDNPDAADQVADHLQHVLYYNDLTKQKIRVFQRTHGLRDDGIVGNETWATVEKLLKEK